MLLSFDRLRLRNFKSFVGEHVFDFPTVPGLYCLTGENRAEPDLGANGVGKSTLWDALYWCLFGRTPRGLRAGALRPWGTEKAGVEVGLTLRLDGEPLELIRSWSPVGLFRVEGGERIGIEQDWLTDRLRLDEGTFLSTVLLSQMGERFFDLSPTEKLTLFTALLRLDSWMDRSALASRRARALGEEIAALKRDIAHVDGRIEADTLTQRQISIQESMFKDSQKADLRRLDKEWKAAKRERESAEAELKKLKRPPKADLADLNAELSTLREQLGDARTGRAEAKVRADAARASVQRVERELARLDSVEGQCPVCLQPVSEKHLAAERKRLEAERKTAAKIVKDSESVTGPLGAKIDALMEDIEAKEGQIEAAADAHREYEATAGRLERLVVEMMATEKQLDDRIGEEQLRVNPHSAALRDILTKIGKAKAQRAKAADKLLDLEESFEATRYWVDGFKSLRLFLVREALTELEVSVGNNLVRLGLRGWSVRFDVERETKGGTISRGFSTFIRSPLSPEEVPWEAWSGGELQRLRLAGAMGVADLILSRVGVAPNLEIWDEPGEHLSDRGIDSMLDALYERAVETGRQVWLTDHQSLDYGGFERRVVVEKTEKGSRIV